MPCTVRELAEDDAGVCRRQCACHRCMRCPARCASLPKTMQVPTRDNVLANGVYDALHGARAGRRQQ
eukprot:12075582-Alexandrium_andersonii.AAC.1